MFKRPLRWAMLLICAFVSAAGAQVTAPTSTQFILNKRFQAHNLIGDMISSATVHANADTMPDVSLKVVVSDTTDSLNVSLKMTLIQGAGIVATQNLDIHMNAELWLPDSVWITGVSDSIFSIVLDNTTRHDPGEEFILEIKPWEDQYDAEGNLRVRDSTFANALEGGRLKVVSDSLSRALIRETRLFEDWE